MSFLKNWNTLGRPQKECVAFWGNFLHSECSPMRPVSKTFENLAKYYFVAIAMQCLYDFQIYKKQRTSRARDQDAFLVIQRRRVQSPPAQIVCRTTICNIGDLDVICMSRQGQAGAGCCIAEHVPCLTHLCSPSLPLIKKSSNLEDLGELCSDCNAVPL